MEKSLILRENTEKSSAKTAELKINKKIKLPMGIEPTTPSLRVKCSTFEPQKHIKQTGNH